MGWLYLGQDMMSRYGLAVSRSGWGMRIWAGCIEVRM
jgi:hypothetical protein